MAVCFMWLVNCYLLQAPRVAILSDNSVTMAIYILAAMLAHKEVLLLNVHLKPSEIENQLKTIRYHYRIT